MGRKYVNDLVFPHGGLHRNYAFQQQPPYTTPDCQNVRPFEAVDGRLRGGSRPGLDLAFYEELGSGNPVRMISQVRAAFTDGLRQWWDTFETGSLGSHWAQATGYSATPGIIEDKTSPKVTSTAAAAVVRTDLDPFDTTQAYQVDVYITPYQNAHHGKYFILLRMDDSSPDITDDGALIEFQITGSNGAYQGTLTSISSGSETEYDLSSDNDGFAGGGWLSVLVNGNTLTVYWRGTSLLAQAISAHTGTRFGFGMQTTESGGACLIDAFRIQYRTGQTKQRLRDRIVVSANGELWRSIYENKLEKLTTTQTLSANQRINAADRAQKLYIADWDEPRVTGTDGVRGTGNTKLDAASVSDWTAHGIDAQDDVVVISDATGDLIDGTYQISSIASGELTLTTDIATGASGTCTFRVERAPKVYDPIADTLTIMSADSGAVPTGCPLICRYRDRIVLAGSVDAPNVWYMSRSGDALDWSYTTDAEDALRPIAGQNSDAGTPGEPLTALMPYSDDYLLMGCQSSLWMLRGDPATMVANLDCLHTRVGVAGPNAWCRGEYGELYFLSYHGIYKVTPGTNPYPENVTREKLPNELRQIDDNLTVELAYDVRQRGVHVYIVGDQGGMRHHWFYALDTQAWMPVVVPNDHEPTAVFEADVNGKPVLLLGGRDGYVREYSPNNETDQGTAIANYVMLGPIALGANGLNEGILRELVATLADDSGDVTWAVQVADAPQQAVEATATVSGTWSQNRNYTVRPNRRGVAAIIKITGSGTRHWAIENLTMVRETVGKASVD